MNMKGDDLPPRFGEERTDLRKRTTHPEEPDRKPRTSTVGGVGLRKKWTDGGRSGLQPACIGFHVAPGGCADQPPKSHHGCITVASHWQRQVATVAESRKARQACLDTEERWWC